MIAFLEAGHPRPDIDDDAGPLMAEDRRKQPLRIGARQRVGIGVADPGRLDFDQHLARFGAVEPHRLDRQGLTRPVGDGSACFHAMSPVDRG
jgi:hypothetical protein